MPITGFQFPGVELTQNYAGTSPSVTTEQAVLCVGPQYRPISALIENSNTYTSAGGIAAQNLPGWTTAIAESYSIPSGDGANQKLIAKNGLYRFALVPATEQEAEADPPVFSVSNNVITFTFAVAYGNGNAADARFGTRGLRVGDYVIITKSGGTTVTAQINKVSPSVEGGKYDSITLAVAASELTGTITSIKFCALVEQVVYGGTDNAFTLNLSGTTPQLTISSGLTTTLADGVTATLEGLESFTFEYRARKTATTVFIDTVTEDTLVDVLGAPSAGNPLSLACKFALSAGGGIGVWYANVAAETVDAYIAALNVADKKTQIYSVVPCTTDDYIIKACVAKGYAESTDPESRVRRTTWYGIDTPVGGDVSTQAGINAIKENLIAKRKAVGTSMRAQCVWANGAWYNKELVPSYAVAAACAGLRAWAPPQRPLSNLAYTLFDVKSTVPFSMAQLREIGANGIWIVDQNEDGAPINYRQVTTAVANDLNQDEESLVSNVDNICSNLMQVGQNYVGNTNITPILLSQLRADITNILNYYTTASDSIYVGPQLLAYEILSIYQDEENKDHVYATISITPPKPFNRLIMTVTII